MLARGRSVVGVLLILSAALAGCLGDEDTPAADTDVGGDAGGDTSGGTDTTGGKNGTDGSGTNAAGEAPLAEFTVLSDLLEAGANVTFNASASSDPDGTNLTYAWDFGDNTTGEGIEVVHVYTAAGNYTVILNVTDVDGRSTTANQTVAIAAGGPGEFSESLTGTIAVPHPILVLTPGGSDLDTYKQRGAAEGTTFEVHELTEVPTNAATVAFELDTSAQNLQYVVFDGEGNQLALRNFPTGASKITLHDEAAQHGHYFVFVYSAVSPSAAYTIDVSVA